MTERRILVSMPNIAFNIIYFYYRKILDILLQLRWIMPSKVIVNCSSYQNIAQVENYFSIYLKLVDLRKMQQDFMHLIFFQHCSICIHRIFYIVILNLKTFSSVMMVMLRLQISVFQRRIFMGTMTQKVFAERLNIWPQKSF